uniref:NHERF family PDZ scaffold protein 2 n=1 Tax=Leptobrachium leishanense TaxID=445787 RepID=A0A8C5QG53_9ANUR
MAQERLQPRLCLIRKGEQGYGFHLHGEKGKSGQYIRKVEPGSPAESAGLKAGDRLLEVNGENVEKETHHQVVQRIKAVENETRLLVVDRETDEHIHLKGERTPSESQLLSRHDKSPEWDINGQVKDLCPRLCYLKKGSSGYGFNLHSEKSRPGQFIRSVDPGSPAAKAGLRPQDRLVEVNGHNVENMKHSEVVANIKAKDNETRLLVVDLETDEYFKKLDIVPTEDHVKGSVPQPLSNGMTQAGDLRRKDPFEESGLRLSPTAAEAKEKARAKRANKRAPQMDWSKKHEIFSNF